MTPENVLARYRILHELGHGATGRVYAARDRQGGAVVALKRFDPALLSKPDAERVLKQVGSARLLKHRNIVAIHEAGEAAGTVYIAMEMLEGESLRKVLDAGPLPITRAIRIAHDIAGGLAHAHLEGVVHGGLKPSNVIVLRSGAAKITDFGIGLVAHAAQLSGYMPPEQSSGAAIDHRCDIFSLGALFYEMLTHQPPPAEPAAPSELNPHVPRALDAIILSMLAPQPASRMAGVPVFVRELQRLEEALGLRSEPEPRAPTLDIAPLREREAFDDQKAIALMDGEARRERSSGSRRGVFATLAVVLALLGSGAAGFIYQASRTERPGSVASRMPEAPATTPAVSPAPPASLPIAKATVKPAPVADATEKPAPPKATKEIPTAAVTPQPSPPPAVEHKHAEQESTNIASVPKPTPPKPPAQSQATPPAAKVREQQPVATARVTLAISPRGDVYIDGQHQGTTPPITTFDLEPGMHRIEVRNGSRTPYLTYMTLQAGDVRRIRYDFDTSRAVHPPRARQGRMATVN